MGNIILGYDLRSYDESLVGSNPTPSKEHFCAFSKKARKNIL